MRKEIRAEVIDLVAESFVRGCASDAKVVPGRRASNGWHSPEICRPHSSVQENERLLLSLEATESVKNATWQSWRQRFRSKLSCTELMHSRSLLQQADSSVFAAAGKQ
jgi:hypothetical protein